MRFCIALLRSPNDKEVIEIMRNHYSMYQTSIFDVDFSKNYEHLYRNDILKKLNSFDFVFQLSAGEILEKQMLDNMTNIDMNKKNGFGDPIIFYKIIRIPQRIYIDNIDQVAFDNNIPVVAVNPREVTFYKNRCCNMNDPYFVKPGTMYLHVLTNLIGKNIFYEPKDDLKMGELNFNKERTRDFVNVSEEILEISKKLCYANKKNNDIPIKKRGRPSKKVDIIPVEGGINANNNS